MARVIILEDEPAALNRIKRLVLKLKPEYEIIGDADSVEEGKALLKKQTFDLIIADIQLSDGLSFEVLETLEKSVPIIFLTAYNQYAVDAFEYNGIHYLLKPIEVDKLNDALNRFESHQINQAKVKDVLHFFKAKQKEGSKNILSKVGNKIQVIDVNDIAYAYLDNGVNRVVAFDGSTYPVDYTMEQLMNKLKSKQYFQINRQMLVNIAAVEEMKKYSSSRLKLTLKPKYEGEAVVSKEKTPFFKQWMVETDY
ncbi:MAG: DNA-binding response regulator [Flavobacteriales bacterium]|nr:DNA-binding response regulator [Flavobacteriales bacterium]|tara:strand:+ start:3561 stop:4319 length:759 start_codon:yes stop_codon:yes gene_type:complete